MWTAFWVTRVVEKGSLLEYFFPLIYIWMKGNAVLGVKSGGIYWPSHSEDRKNNGFFDRNSFFPICTKKSPLFILAQSCILFPLHLLLLNRHVPPAWMHNSMFQRNNNNNKNLIIFSVNNPRFSQTKYMALK